jgi:hypothetical protein
LVFKFPQWKINPSIIIFPTGLESWVRNFDFLSSFGIGDSFLPIQIWKDEERQRRSQGGVEDQRESNACQEIHLYIHTYTYIYIYIYAYTCSFTLYLSINSHKQLIKWQVTPYTLAGIEPTILCSYVQRLWPLHQTTRAISRNFTELTRRRIFCLIFASTNLIKLINFFLLILAKTRYLCSMIRICTYINYPKFQHRLELILVYWTLGTELYIVKPIGPMPLFLFFNTQAMHIR